MKEIYRLHEKATALLELCKYEDNSIDGLKIKIENYTNYHNIVKQAEHDLDIKQRALKRLKYSYMKVLMQIAEL